MRTLLIMLSFTSCALMVRAGVTVNAADFGLSEEGDATAALRTAVEACHTLGADRLVIPAGVYQIYPTQAFQKYCAISNNDNGMKHIALPVIGFDGLTIEAAGVELMLHGQMMAMVIEASQNVVVEGLTIDWAQQLHFQGTVIAVNEKENYFDLRTSEETNASIVRGKLVNTEVTTPQIGGKLDPWWTPWQQDLEWSFVFEGDDKRTTEAYPSGSPLNGAFMNSLKYRVESLGDRRFRLFNAAKDYPVVGMTLVAKGAITPNRTSPAIHLFKAFDVTLQNVTIHHAGGMGLIGERSGNITLNKFDVRIRPGSDRVISTTADATHFVGCRGLIKFEGCYFENMLDDATNVHGTYTRIEKQTGPRTVLAKLMHFQQFGFVFAEAGDVLRFSSQTTLVPFAEATATQVKIINDQFMEITFDRDLGGLLTEASILDNLSWQADVHMRGCTVSRNRARSILLSTGGDILIENNTFDRSSMMNILMEGDAYVWHESCPVRNVRIIGNHFIDRNPDVEAIRISPKLPAGVVPGESYHRNVVIEGNIFETRSPNLLMAAHAEAVRFRNNKIVPANDYVTGSSDQPAFRLENTPDVTIEGNDNQLPQPLKLKADSRSQQVKVMP